MRILVIEMRAFAYATRPCSGQVAEVPGSFWGETGSRLRANRLRVTLSYILDDLGIGTNFKTSYGIERLKKNDLENNCP